MVRGSKSLRPLKTRGVEPGCAESTPPQIEGRRTRLCRVYLLVIIYLANLRCMVDSGQQILENDYSAELIFGYPRKLDPCDGVVIPTVDMYYVTSLFNLLMSIGARLASRHDVQFLQTGAPEQGGRGETRPQCPCQGDGGQKVPLNITIIPLKKALWRQKSGHGRSAHKSSFLG